DGATGIAAQSVRCKYRLGRKDSVTEGRLQVVQGAVQPGEIRVIEHVECVDTELEAHALFDIELLLERHVEIDCARGVQIVDAGFEAQASHARHKEAGRIETVKWIVRMRVRITSFDDADAGAFGAGAGVIGVTHSLHGESWSKGSAGCRLRY